MCYVPSDDLLTAARRFAPVGVDAALLTAEQYQRRLEFELIEARKPKLPWKKGK